METITTAHFTVEPIDGPPEEPYAVYRDPAVWRALPAPRHRLARLLQR